MKKIIYLILFLVIIIIVILFLLKKNSTQNNTEDLSVFSSSQLKDSVLSPANNSQIQDDLTKKESNLRPPMKRIDERVTKKPFGIFVSPQSSPVQPEKFYGYHTAADFEIFSEEENWDILIKAICSGKLLVKKSASGYGGVIAQSCDLNNEPITVIYGHLKLSSIGKKLGDDIVSGEELGVLGRGYSEETDGERKHLHLGIHRGEEINILGYVARENLLVNWIDPMLLFKK